MSRLRNLLFVIVTVLVWTTASHAEDATFALKGGERIVFFGDSITQSGGYIADLEVYLLTRFPEKRWVLLNRGISSETISGTSEPDHSPRRPFAHDRFSRDVASWKPDVVVSCFGMNDGNYYPFEPERFLKYQQGVSRLVERVRSETNARLVILTPPPFDPYRRSASDPNATQFGYKFPAIDYDGTLERYSGWLRDQTIQGWFVVDLHSAVNDLLRARRREQVSFHVAPDAVHPNATGHWIMAQTLLLAWHAPAAVAEAVVDVAANQVNSENITSFKVEQPTVSFTWKTPLPMPLDRAWDEKSLGLLRVSERLNRYRLVVKGLGAGDHQFQARWKGDSAWTVAALRSAEDYASGLDLSTIAAFPPVQQASVVRDRTLKRRQAIDAAWRASRQKQTPDPASKPDPELEAIRQACQPREVEIRIIQRNRAFR